MAIIHLDPPPDPPAKPRLWIAILLTIVTTGLGHLYAGAPKRAAFFFVAWLSVYATALLLAAAGLLLPPWPGPSSVLPASILAAAGVACVLLALIDVVRTARAPRTFEPRWFNRWDLYVGIAVLGWIASSGQSTLLKRYFVQAFWFPSSSMEPTLLVGDHFFVDKQAYDDGEPPRRGELVVFASPVDATVVLVKRAVAIAGDTVEIRAKTLHVNQVAVDETYVQFIDAAAGRPPRDDFGPQVVPEGKVFVLGDNRDRSYDSRYFGLVPVKNLIGRPVVIYWSRNEGTTRWDRIGMRAR